MQTDTDSDMVTKDALEYLQKQQNSIIGKEYGMLEIEDDKSYTTGYYIRPKVYCMTGEKGTKA